MAYMLRNGLLVPKRKVETPKHLHARRPLPDARFPHIWIPRAIPARAAVAFDAIATANSHTTGTTVVTLSNANETVGTGSNRALICVASFESVVAPTAFNARWDTAGTNQAMAQIGSTISNGNFRVVLFGLLAPTSGNKNFTLSWTNTASCYLSLISFTGVDQTSTAIAFPHFNSATATSTGPATVNITSATGNYTVATFVSSPAGDLTTLNQTTLYAPDITDPNCSGAANYAVGTASNTHSCTISASSAWAVCGCDVLAASGGDTLQGAQQMKMM